MQWQTLFMAQELVFSLAEEMLENRKRNNRMLISLFLFSMHNKSY